MAKITKKTEERIQSGMAKFQKVLAIAKARDLNESDTVRIITDILAEVFGYDKYQEVTSELAVRGTYCDLAIKCGEKFQYLIECKAIGTDLKENHLRQVVGYGANKGIQWVILTNGADWQIYRIRFEQPIAWDLVNRFDLCAGSSKDERFMESVYLVSKEGVEKCARDDVYEKIQCVNRFIIGAIMQTEPVIVTVKRELKKLADGVRIEDSEILALIKESVIRRDLVEGEEAAAAAAKLSRMAKALKPKKDTPKAEVPSDAGETITETLLGEVAAEQTPPTGP
jgi:predicted type IV restriction endonuclease